MSYDNTNRGSAWGNDKKEKDTHPDFKGSINVEGKEFWFSMWKRKSDANPKAPAVSFQIVAKEDVQREGVENTKNAINKHRPSTPQDNGFEDDLIPF